MQFPSSFMDSQKYTKTGTPLRPIIFIRGAVTYGVTKELANIIQPMVGQSPHHIKITQQFINHIKSLQMLLREVMVSYNVKALFTSVPVDPAINIVQSRLQQDLPLP